MLPLPVLLTAPFRGRMGTYTITVYDARDGAVSTNASYALLNVSRLRFGESKSGYINDNVIPSFFEATFNDPQKTLASIFFAHKENDFPVQVTGPGFMWCGYVKRGDLTRYVAGRTFTNETTVYIYDRLAHLRQRPGLPVKNTPLDVVINYAFQHANFWCDVITHVDAKAQGAADSELQRLRYAEEVVGSGKGDYGTIYDQLSTIAAHFGCLAFMDFTSGEWNFVHRASMGLARDVYRYVLPKDEEPASIPTNTEPRAAKSVSVPYALQRGEKSDHWISLEGLGTLILEGAGAINWVIDGNFDVFTDNDPNPDSFLYWLEVGEIYKNDPLPRVITGSGGGSTSQVLGNFTADVNVRVRLQFEFVNTVKSSIRLAGVSGTEYWLSSAGLWETTYQEQSQTSGALTTAIHKANEDFPEAGQVSITLSASSSLNQWGKVAFFLIDETDALIDDWRFVISADEGGILTIKAAPDIESDNGSTWSIETDWQSELYDTGYASINDYMAADRLAQDVPGIENYQGGIFLPIGPNARLMIQKGKQIDGTPVFQSFVPVGGDVDLKTGMTIATWTELPADLGA